MSQTRPKHVQNISQNMSQKLFNYLNWDVDVDFQWLYFLSTIQSRWVPKIPAVSCFAVGKICSQSFPWSHKCNLYMAWFRGRWLISSEKDEKLLKTHEFQFESTPILSSQWLKDYRSKNLSKNVEKIGPKNWSKKLGKKKSFWLEIKLKLQFLIKSGYFIVPLPAYCIDSNLELVVVHLFIGTMTDHFAQGFFVGQIEKIFMFDIDPTIL